MFKWIKPFPLALSIAFIFFSCTTFSPENIPDVMDWIPSDSNVLTRLSVQENEELVDILSEVARLDGSVVQAIKDRCVLIGIGMNVQLPSKEENALYLAAIGNWPRAFIGSGLGKDWKPSKKSSFRWNGPGGMELTALRKSVILVSRGRMDEFIAQTEKRESVVYQQKREFFLEKADFSLYMDGKLLVSLLTGGMPASSLQGLISVEASSLQLVREEKNNYKASLQIYLKDDSYTKALALAFRFALSARLGLSPNPELRALLSSLSLQTFPRRIYVNLPGLSGETLRSFLEVFGFIPTLSLENTE